MLRILIVLVFFSSCNKNIYSKKGDDGSIRHLSLLWKKSGEYRGAFAAYKIKRLISGSILFPEKGRPWPIFQHPNYNF